MERERERDIFFQSPQKSAFLVSVIGSGGERGGKQPKLLGGREEGGGRVETSVLLGALLRNGRVSPPASPGLGARRALHFILANSWAKIDIETEGNV